MEFSNFFSVQKNNIENLHKMEIEQAHNMNHSNMIRNYLFSKRVNNINFPFSNNKNKTLLFTNNTFEPNVVTKNIEEIFTLFQTSQNISNINKSQIDAIKSLLLEHLQKIRKELSKESISLSDAKNIFNNKTQSFIQLLFSDFYDPYIQLESLWIINNLMYLIAKYNNNNFFIDVKSVSSSLIQCLINTHNSQRNDGVKYTLEEKILRIFGNLININNNIIESLINNQIIPFIINSLNSPISSLRTTCLWLLNKILLALKKLEAGDYISLFVTKNAISNYKFILSRFEKQHSFDEIGELFWLLNELVKYDSVVLLSVFFTDAPYSCINKEDIIIYLNKELALKNFEFVLDNCLTNKLFQPCFKMISNLLAVCAKNAKNEELLNKLTECFFNKQSILRFINDVLNSPKNKYEYQLVKDILLLIFNLMSISAIKSSVLFKNGITNLISGKEYQNDNEIMKLLYFIYYKIRINNAFIFENNDEKVIQSILFIMGNFKDDSSVLIIFTDILFIHLNASHVKIGEDIINEIQIISNSNDNIPLQMLQNVLLKLSTYFRMNTPI